MHAYIKEDYRNEIVNLQLDIVLDSSSFDLELNCGDLLPVGA